MQHGTGLQRICSFSGPNLCMQQTQAGIAQQSSVSKHSWGGAARHLLRNTDSADSEAAWLPGSLPPGCGPSRLHVTRGPAAGTPAWAGACRAVAAVVMSGQVDQWAVLPTALPAPLCWHQEVQQPNPMLPCPCYHQDCVTNQNLTTLVTPGAQIPYPLHLPPRQPGHGWRFTLIMSLPACPLWPTFELGRPP